MRPKLVSPNLFDSQLLKNELPEVKPPKVDTLLHAVWVQNTDCPTCLGTAYLTWIVAKVLC